MGEADDEQVSALLEASIDDELAGALHELRKPRLRVTDKNSWRQRLCLGFAEGE
jgi:hypothetical protein